MPSVRKESPPHNVDTMERTGFVELPSDNKRNNYAEYYYDGVAVDAVEVEPDEDGDEDREDSDSSSDSEDGSTGSEG